MADEITVGISLSARNGLHRSSRSISHPLDQTVAAGTTGVPEIGVNPELLDWGEITNPGPLILYNHSADVAVLVGVMSGMTFVPAVLVPPQAASLLYPYAYMYVRTVSGTARLEWMMEEGEVYIEESSSS